MYCGGPGCSPWTLIGGWICGRRAWLCDWPQFPERRTMWTYQGRVAVAIACERLGLREGDEVLAPAYNCGAEVDPVLQTGAKIVLYRVTRRAAIDLADIMRRVTDRTRLVYVIHYFGWPQEMQELMAFCRQRGLRVLEDCALALFSRTQTEPLGSLGDVAIFNFPKHLPVSDGGALVFASDDAAGLTLPYRPSWRPVFRRALSLSKCYMMGLIDKLGVYPWWSRLVGNGAKRVEQPGGAESRPDMPADYYFQPNTAAWGVTRLGRGLLMGVEPDRIVRARRRNYLQLYSLLEGVPGIEFLYDDLPPGVSPLGFPVLVSDRTGWVEELISRGIAAIPWWAGYHRSLDWSPFPEAAYLKDHLVVLPIHQDLGARHIEYIAECVRRLSTRRYSTPQADGLSSSAAPDTATEGVRRCCGADRLL